MLVLPVKSMLGFVIQVSASNMVGFYKTHTERKVIPYKSGDLGDNTVQPPKTKHNTYSWEHGLPSSILNNPRNSNGISYFPASPNIEQFYTTTSSQTQAFANSKIT